MEYNDPRLIEKIREELDPVDMGPQYRDMLDDCYSFKDVGGPFEHMQPSRILEEVDPVAYRCGYADWLDGELGQTIEEIDGEYWDYEEVEVLREQLQDTIDAEESEDEEA